MKDKKQVIESEKRECKINYISIVLVVILIVLFIWLRPVPNYIG